MRRFLIATWVIGTALAVPGAGRAVFDFTGSYTVASPNGEISLTLQQSADGTVDGVIVMPGPNQTCEIHGTVTVDEDEEWSVEGMITCAGGRSDFEFSADEDGAYLLLVIPYDPSGAPLSHRAAVYYARRAVAAGPPELGSQAPPRHAPPRQVSPREALDPRLFGIWATQVIVNTPGGSVATQLFMELRSDGTLVDLGSRSVGGVPGVGADTGLEGGGEVAAWRTRGNVLEVSYAGNPWVALATFEVSGDRLYFAYYDGDRKLWHRQ